MKVLSYLVTNVLFLFVIGMVGYKGLKNGGSPFYLILFVLVSLVIINLSIFFLEKLLDKVINFAFRLYEKKKMKNYSLYEWMGETRWVKLLDNLSNKKDFKKDLLHENFQMIKNEIMYEFNSKEKLVSLKLYLEVIVESPKLTILNTVTQTMLLALITTSLISFLKGAFLLEGFSGS